MDRRQLKTREAIILAFSKLLEYKQYHNITVQDIIDEANIGRSTFYAHFETKDELLKILCSQMFEHVFSEVLSEEEGHDFSKDNVTLEAKLTHLLYHLKEQKKELLRVLLGESNEIFMRFFRSYLEQLFSKYVTDNIMDVPKDFVINYYVSSFVEAVKWWTSKKMKESPEMIVKYYMVMINK